MNSKGRQLKSLLHAPEILKLQAYSMVLVPA